MAGYPPTRKARGGGGVPLPPLSGERATPPSFNEQLRVAKDTLADLNDAIADKNYIRVGSLLKQLEGAKYERLVSGCRAQQMWSLEETLASRICKARAQYIGWTHKYKAARALLEKGMESQDLMILRRATSGWPYHRSDPVMKEAEKVKAELEVEYKADLAAVQKAHLSKKLPEMRECVKRWKWTADDHNLAAIREIMRNYAHRRRHAQKAVEARDLDTLQQALDNMEVQTDDPDVVECKKCREKWEKLMTTNLPVLQKAIQGRDIATLRRLLLVGMGELDFTHKDLIPARAKFRDWQQVQADESMQLRQALQKKDAKLVKYCIDNWTFDEPSCSVLAEGRRVHEKFTKQKAEMDEALEGKKVPVMEKLMKDWALDHPPVQAEKLVQEFQTSIKFLQDATDRRDVETVQGRLDSLKDQRKHAGKGTPSAEVFRRAEALLVSWEEAKDRVLSDECYFGELKRTVENWVWPKDDTYKAARKREKKYSAAVEALRSAKAPYDIACALEDWPFSQGDPVVQQMKQKVSGYARAAGAIRRACLAKDIDALTAALEDWPHGSEDPAYVAAMDEFDAFTAQMRVVKAALETQTGEAFEKALAQMQYKTGDVDFADLQYQDRRYKKVTAELEDAMAAGDDAQVQELLDEWEFAPSDAAVARAKAWQGSGADERRTMTAKARAASAVESERPATVASDAISAALENVAGAAPPPAEDVPESDAYSEDAPDNAADAGGVEESEPDDHNAQESVAESFEAESNA